ncbi:hypothetical protein [Rariglobus hedericola]|uniref:Lipoprotein n=1 Tax=Rariglobus hedericola TaxID=2597822 RepID=A0A556QRJ1_9BACT|nr:hypothetical protein [Rariglobus hedericola]TSJ79242.1 hypothetical protein FPL22_08105 [Rariglobus hedericola]
MKKVLFLLSLSFITLLTSGCATFGKPKEIDPATGRIKTQSIYGQVKPTVLRSDSIHIGTYRDMILVLGGDDFVVQQTINFGFFKEVVTREQLEQKLIRDKKTDIVSDVSGLLSWKKVADNYKPFLVLKPAIRREGRDTFMKFTVYAADTATQVFEAEIEMDFVWKGINDDIVFYPLYNSFIDWVKAQKE